MPFRLGAETERKLADRADIDGVSAPALLERLVIEGVDQLRHPGIVYRGPAHARRAALSAGPDVWEVIARLRELDGSEEERIVVLCAESALHPRLIRAAVDYAAEHGEEIESRIDRNRRVAENSRRAVQERARLFV
ncbi:hypothetical protein [Saccharomonospora iraqiensis]|uniref:hypothetical protein n=1 Tax=Saccharomonospora iraqiensis TaxID=52698 RepID=UPI001F15C120|nr:hypothetical protein [Saccharomonospora iraqiensis]